MTILLFLYYNILTNKTTYCRINKTTYCRIKGGSIYAKNIRSRNGTNENHMEL